MIGEFNFLEVKPTDLEKVFGEIAYLKDGNIAFKCGSPNACSQCGRCGSPKDARPD